MYPDVADLGISVVRNEGNPTESLEWQKFGMKVIHLIAGPYNTGGVRAININEWVEEAVAYVKANPKIYAVEMLNEANGDWYWGPNADSQENASAYVKLLESVHAAYTKEFGSARPLIISSFGGPSVAPVWGERMLLANPDMNLYCDGVVVHPYPSSGKGEANRVQVETAHKLSKLPVFITEVGWNTTEVTEAEQAQCIKNFAKWCKEVDYIAAVTFFGYRDYGTSDFWGIETHEGRKKLAYAALQSVAKL